MKLTTLTSTGTTGSQTVNDAVFGVTPNLKLLAQAVRVYQLNKRQGTAHTKTRSDVDRSKSKWYRQKGTGNARHGSKNAPIFVGGGVAHGPKANRNWSRTLSTTQKQKALISALSGQVENIIIVDALQEQMTKTKAAVTALGSVLTPNSKILIVLAEYNPEQLRVLRNINNVLVVQSRQVSALEITLADKIVLTSDSVKALEKRLIADSKE